MSGNAIPLLSRDLATTSELQSKKTLYFKFTKILKLKNKLCDCLLIRDIKDSDKDTIDDNQTIITDTEEDNQSNYNNENFTQFYPRNEFVHSDVTAITPAVKPKEKLFKCTYNGCEKVYRSKENLKLHIQNIHKKLKPYQCSYCPLKFSHRNGRIYHERKVHTSFFPYKCNFEGCKHSFPCKSAMDVHIKTYHLVLKKFLFKVKEI